MQKYSFFVVCTIFLLIFHAFWRRLPCILFLDNCILAPFVGHSEDLPAWHMQRSKNAKTYCTLLPKSPEKTIRTSVQKPENLQKFWQGIASLLERILAAFSTFCHPVLSILWYWCVQISAEFVWKCGKKLKNAAKSLENAVFLVQKHRTSWAQTSVLLKWNIGSLWQRSPMFPFFRPKSTWKSPFPDFAIFQNEARCGGFRGHSQPVNDVVREGWRHLKKVVGKYCTLACLSPNPRRSF